jgi:hypothetical protein
MKLPVSHSLPLSLHQRERLNKKKTFKEMDPLQELLVGAISKCPESRLLTQKKRGLGNFPHRSCVDGCDNNN